MNSLADAAASASTERFHANKADDDKACHLLTRTRVRHGRTDRPTRMHDEIRTDKL
jgi:hypothetical protein